MKVQKDSYSKTSKEVNRPYKVVKFAKTFALEYIYLIPGPTHLHLLTINIAWHIAKVQLSKKTSPPTPHWEGFCKILLG